MSLLMKNIIVNKLELPSQLEYFIRQMEQTKNRQQRYEYFLKIKEIRDHLSKTLDKYKLEFSNEK